VSNFNDQSVTTIDVVAGTAVATTRLTANAYRLALSADESTLFVSSTSGKVFAIGTSTNTVTSSTQLSGSLQGMALSSAGDALYVSATEGTVYRLNAATLAVTASRSLGGLPQDVAVSPAGGEIYVANQSGWIDVLDAASLAPRAQVTSCGAFGLAVTRDGAQLYATCPASSVVVIADAASRTLLTTMGAATPRRIAFSANGEFAAVANEGNFVDIIR
jgi:DNA-binding beta-propeller fold protein YncE